MVGTAAPQVSFDRGFFSSAYELGSTDAKRVFKAIDQLSADPNYPSLNLEPLKDGSARLHTIRVSQEVRILLAREGNLYHLIEAGHHDEIYSRARRGSFVVNPHTHFVGFIAAKNGDERPEPEPARHRPAPGDETPRVFDHWADKDLVDAGFDEHELAALRGCRVEDELLDADLDEEALSLALDLLEVTPEQWRAPTLADPATEAEERVRRAITEFGALNGISPLFPAEEVARIAAAPIEDWMIFLHPNQRTVVERRYAGPARVRGAAGTGKTVVALHRAAALAKRFRDEPAEGPKTILFTTFIRSLPPVFEQLYQRLPGARSGEIDFTNVDRLARRVATGAGHQIVVDPRAIDAAYASAWRKVVTSGSPLQRAGLSRGYLRDEVSAVIKGRGVRTLDEYLNLDRVGRRTPFSEAHRSQTWALMTTWGEEMASRGTVDFPDIVILARDAARALPTPTYRAAIIDEAQDITLVGLQLVRALVNAGSDDPPDGLFFVGDGAQRIYAGGFTLRQAGVEVRGRTTVLGTNYRNTKEILAAAMAVAGDEPVNDLGDEFRRGEAETDSDRNGTRPALICCASKDDEAIFLATHIRSITSHAPIGLGDIGVFAPTNLAVDDVLARLAAAGIACKNLDRYDGRPSDHVKVGTYHRAKGLEFKVVFLPGLTEGEFPRPRSPDQDPTEYAEARSLALSQLFVAMTRARDGLYLLCSGNPSEVVVNGLDRFEVIDS